MQADGLLLSIGIGVVLGVAYVAASFISNRRALRSKRHPMVLVAGSMLLRMLAVLIVLIGILLLLPVTPTALMGSFFVMFAAGLAVEIWLFHRKSPAGRSPDASS